MGKKLKIVLDTNVLVSALLRPKSIPAQVLDLVVSRHVQLALDHRIFAEYQEVLARPEFAFPPDQVRTVLDFVWQSSERILAVPLPLQLPDAEDLMFIEVAVNSLASALVTGNIKHFPTNQRHGVNVCNPREFLEMWSKVFVAQSRPKTG